MLLFGNKYPSKKIANQQQAIVSWGCPKSKIFTTEDWSFTELSINFYFLRETPCTLWLYILMRLCAFARFLHYSGRDPVRKCGSLQTEREWGISFMVKTYLQQKNASPLRGNKPSFLLLSSLLFPHSKPHH